MLLVTGGAGFIGSNFIHRWFGERREGIVNLDALTYAGNPANLKDLPEGADHRFVRGNICDQTLVRRIFAECRPRAVIHFAAESHVDRSIAGPDVFVTTNVLGTTTLLDAARDYWLTLKDAERDAFRFLNISTDEVYGSMTAESAPALEATPFDPSSPYSASKAAADQFGRAYRRTYGLPVITLRCTNNYGPRQYPEKLTPSMILRALRREPLPLYGSGRQIRDWIHTDDFCSAIRLALDQGQPGEIYNVGAGNELANIDYVRRLCRILDRLRPRPDGRPYEAQIIHVADRPGHDVRYALNAQKIRRTLGWRPVVDFKEGLEKTAAWYMKAAGF